MRFTLGCLSQRSERDWNLSWSILGLYQTPVTVVLSNGEVTAILLRKLHNMEITACLDESIVERNESIVERNAHPIIVAIVLDDLPLPHSSQQTTTFKESCLVRFSFSCTKGRGGLLQQPLSDHFGRFAALANLRVLTMDGIFFEPLLSLTGSAS